MFPGSLTGFVFVFSDLILYIVLCTYKSVVGLGHNGTEPVKFFYENEFGGEESGQGQS